MADAVMAIFCDPGPGDALRFLHSFCNYLADRKSTGSVLLLPEAQITSTPLFESSYLFRRGAVELIRAQSIEEARALLPRRADIIFHPFESRYYCESEKKLVDEITTGLSCAFFQMDKYENYRYMNGSISDNLHVPRRIRPARRKALLFVRSSHIAPGRNLSERIARSILSLAEERGVKFTLAGSPLPEALRDTIPSDTPHLFGRGSLPDYFSQMLIYGEYEFAIGMNSGGLDLATAAGVDTIRLGEYHHLLSHQGANYNAFLSRGRAVRVANVTSSSEEDTSNITRERIAVAFDALEKCGQTEGTEIWI